MEPTQNSWLLTSIKHGHQAFVFQRRVRILAEMLASQIPRSSSVLDIGCGDGTIASLIAQLRPDILIQGAEVMVRPDCLIECHKFDGSTLPFANQTFDVCLMVDVLHHTNDITASLREAVRVSRSFILLKDHISENWFDHSTLRLMDWVGNRPHGVQLTYNYQSREQWSRHFAECGLHESTWTAKIPLYPIPFNFVLERRLHFISLLKRI